MLRQIFICHHNFVFVLYLCVVLISRYCELFHPSFCLPSVLQINQNVFKQKYTIIIVPIIVFVLLESFICYRMDLNSEKNMCVYLMLEIYTLKKLVNFRKKGNWLIYLFNKSYYLYVVTYVCLCVLIGFAYVTKNESCVILFKILEIEQPFYIFNEHLCCI